MRRTASIAAIAASLAAAACATSAGDWARSEKAQSELDRQLAGKTAGKPQTCLPALASRDQIVIDEGTILYRDGARRVWRNDVRGPCNGLGRPGISLVVRTTGTGQLCSGDIFQLVDLTSGVGAGSCAFGDFVPYEGLRRS